MTSFKIKLQIAPNPIFRKRAVEVGLIDSEIKSIISSMFDIMYEHGAVGISANIVGVLKRIVVIDLQTKSHKDQIVMINPVITKKSQELQKFEEGSISYPGIKAMVERPKKITVEYVGINGESNILDAENWFATVIQHEVDYLDGKIFLDYVPLLRRKVLLKQIKKYSKNNR